jgi:hypothetical protein
MKWPFGGKQKIASIAPVVLTDEEQQECQAMLVSLLQAEDGSYVMREELIDSFKRSIVALCMMGRAERFVILANSDQQYRERACEAAAKACSAFPLSIYFYDFGCILKRPGKLGEAKKMFAEFLRRQATEALDPIMRSVLNQRDVERAVEHAKQEV